MKTPKAKSSQAEYLSRAFDPVLFSRSLGIEPDAWQKEVLTSSSKRIILNCSRQSGKTTISAVKALYEAIFVPESLVLIVSPSLRQSTEMFRVVLNLLAKTTDHGVSKEETKMHVTFANGSRVVSLPCSEQTIRGYSAVRLVIVDEASQVEDAVYYTIRPMLSTSNGALLLLSTPSGQRGFFWQEWTKGIGWTKIRLPATGCRRIPARFLEEERNVLGDLWYRQEYGCEFIQDGENVFPQAFIDAAFVDWCLPLWEETPCSS